MALASNADIEAILQITIDSDPNGFVQKLHDLTQGAIERVTGARYTAATVDELVDGWGDDEVWTTYWPVSDVTAVFDNGIAAVEGTDFEWYKSGKLVRTSSTLWPGIDRAEVAWTRGRKKVRIQYTSGYATVDAVPYGLRDLAAQITARRFRTGAAFANSPDGSEGVTRIRLDDYEAEFAPSLTDMTAVRLTDDELAAVKTFRRRRGQARVTT